MRRREECGGGENNNEETEMRNMSPIPTINMNNVYSQREKEFMNDYKRFSNGAVSGQSPTAVSNRYRNISQNRRNYLKTIVQNKLTKK